MTRFFFAASLAFLLAMPASSQTQQSLHVTARDAFDDAPLAGATIELYQDGELLQTQVADQNGQVAFSVTVVGVEDLPSTGFRIGSPYPNPSVGRSTIPFELDRSGPVTVTVFDVLGRSVTRSVDTLPAGNHEVRLDLAGLSTGTYFIRFEQAGRSATARPITLSSGVSGAPGVSFGAGRNGKDQAGKTGVGPNDYDVRVTAADYDARQVAVSMPAQNDVTVKLDLTPVLGAKTIVVDSTALSLARMTASGLVFSIEGASPTIEVGDILVGEQGDAGYLRRVTGVVVDGDSVRITTEKATLVEAIESGTLKSSVSFGGAGKRQGWTIESMADGLAFCEDGLTLFCLDDLTLWEGDLDPNYLPAKRVYIASGGLTFDPVIDLALRIQAGSVRDFSAVASGDLSISADLAVEADVPFNQQAEVTVFTGRHVAQQMIGSVPVVEVVTLRVVAGFDLDTGEALYVEPGMDAGVSFDLGASYHSPSPGIDGLWEQIYNPQASFQEHRIRWNPFTTTTIKGYISPRIDIRFYGVAGPSLVAEPYLRQTGTVTGPSWEWGMFGGMDASLEFDNSMLDAGLAGLDATLASFEEPLVGDSGLMPVTESNSIGMELVRIPAGSFEMGDTISVTTPIHEISFSHDLLIGKYEVTQEEYLEVTGQNPSYFSSYADTTLWGPVEQVSWFDAVSFANSLSSIEGLSPCYDGSGNVIGGDIYACEGYRLPTEAEWEYVTRAGTTSVYFFGDDPEPLGDFAWSFANQPSRTRDVGTRLPNPWGLYDVYGNVWEWINDWYSSTYYAESPPSDPPGPTSGTHRVARGGGWSMGDTESVFRSGSHQGIVPEGFIDWLGFRIARTVQ